MKYKAVLFDLDGTLLNTIDDLAESTNTVLERMGFPVNDVDKYKYFVGNGVYNLVKRALPEDKRDDITVRTCTDAMLEEYNKRLTKKTRPYEGIPELLDCLSSKGIRMAILSNKPDAATQQIVGELLGKWDFEAAFGEREGVPRKPDPTAVYQVVQSMGLKPQDFLYLGDSGVDMETANAAGMFAVGALWGFREAEELKKAGARVLITKPDELINIFDTQQ